MDAVVRTYIFGVKYLNSSQCPTLIFWVRCCKSTIVTAALDATQNSHRESSDHKIAFHKIFNISSMTYKISKAERPVHSVIDLRLESKCQPSHHKLNKKFHNETSYLNCDGLV